MNGDLVTRPPVHKTGIAYAGSTKLQSSEGNFIELWYLCKVDIWSVAPLLTWFNFDPSVDK